MNKWKTLLVAVVLIPLIVFIVLAGRSVLSFQQVEDDRRALVAVGGSTKTERRVPSWLQTLKGADFHTFLDETILAEVTMSGPEIDDAAAERLRGLDDLRILDLSQSAITDAGLRALSGLTDLRQLNLFKTQISDLTPLEPLSRLEVLILEHTLVTDDALASLVHLRELRELNVGYLELGDTGIGHVAKCSKVQTLGLSGTDLTEQQCELLAQLKDLKLLVIRNANASPEGLRALQKALPGLEQIIRQ
jgi:hypothetical protein